MTPLEKAIEALEKIAGNSVPGGHDQVMAQETLTLLRAQPQEWPSEKALLQACDSAWKAVPSQDNEGYTPGRGDFKIGFWCCYHWLKDRMGK